MKRAIQTYSALIVLALFLFQVIIPHHVASGAKVELMYPIQEMSKLECRFQNFDSLSSSCKMILPVLNTKDYQRYATKDGGYNDFTRIYTVLWGSSYKYGWDVGNGGHQGVDIATARGTPIYNIADGKVIRTGNDAGWGKFISIEHKIKGKTIVSNYAHLDSILVKKGQNIKLGTLIGKVGSTGNSTGNHLHFQIDLPYKFHPYYYDYSSCPHSYYDITETGVCFDDLEKHTIDPLKFLESNGAILDTIKVEELTRAVAVSQKNSYSPTNIFSTTVYHGYGTNNDVKEIQRIYNKLGYYTGRISGDFSDIEETIISYQLATGILETRNDEGAGWFGPKTRNQTKKDYDAYVASGGQSILAVSTSSKTTSKQTETSTTQKVSRKQLMTREEREAQEMAEFLNIYTIDFENTISHIETNTSKETLIKIENKRGKPFRGNTPGNVSFQYDESKVSIFPNSFYNFKDGTRNIKITGKNQGHTTISIKIGEVIVKTLSVSVGKKGAAKIIDSAQIYAKTKVAQGEKSTAIILMKDQYKNKVVGAKYDDRFEVDLGKNAKYCVKQGDVKDVKAIYVRDCFENEYKDTLEFGYEDTISGVLIFDYKVYNEGKADLILKKSGKDFSEETLVVVAPNDLHKVSEYKTAIAYTIEKKIASPERGFFLPERTISEYDATQWLKNSLRELGRDDSKITVGKREKTITRKDFLELVSHHYQTGTPGEFREYRDSEPVLEDMVATTLGADYSWKDQFGEFYFQPEKKITRAEVSYMLYTLHNRSSLELVRK